MIAGSTPVIAFGDSSQARIATLGINPSHKEFVEMGRLLRGTERRLATLESLGVKRLDGLTYTQMATVVADCTAYFDRRPYRRWFDPLDKLMHEAVNASYYDRSACHLDLVQWATDPAWGGISDRRIKHALLDDGGPHLEAQLTSENIGLVLVNGRSVLAQVKELGLVDLEEVARLPLGRGSCRLYRGTGCGIRWVGWSANLQSSWGISNKFTQRLGAWLAESCAAASSFTAPAAPLRASAPDADGHLPRGFRVHGKSELMEVLREWLSRSRAATIGDVGSFGGRAWLLIDLGGEEVALNADTKRSAIETVVSDSATDPESPWRIVANNRGRFNKVLPGLDPLPGWYAYLKRPRSEEGVV